ncbi:MAG: DUF2865 domain-containing protein [Hyphomicrobiaceae bacterium]
MFNGQLGMQSALRLGAYVATIVAIAALTGWSAYRVGATVIGLLDAKIIDGSGRPLPEPQWSAPPFAADPRSEQASVGAEDLSGGTTQLTSASATPVTTAPRASSDAPENDPAADFHHGSKDTFKTYCVRLCDGFYWPISFSTTSDRFEDDASACQSSCGSPARLFVHPIPGGGPATMVSLDGLPYTALKSAFVFRTRYDAQCRCQPQPWQKAAKDRHKLFAAAEAAERGSKTAIAEALRLKDKVTAARKAEYAARELAEEKANEEMEKLARTASLTPPDQSPRTRRTGTRREAPVIRLGSLDEDTPRKRGFVPSSGPSRAWQDRMFGDN